MASQSAISSFDIGQAIFIDGSADVVLRSDSSWVNSEAAAKSEHSKAVRKIDLDDGRIGVKMLSVIHAVIERQPRLFGSMSRRCLLRFVIPRRLLE